MLMVILGAGASYDSIPAYPPGEFPNIDERPPLADQLFENRGRFREVMASYPICHPIIPHLQRRGGKSLERVLQSFQEEAREYPVRHQQLAAVRYYLQHLFRTIEPAWMGYAHAGTNHKSLLDQINRWRSLNGPVCLVTFNYDTLIENALELVGITIRTLPDYISNQDFKLFKMHGSAKWVRLVKTVIPNLINKNQWELSRELTTQAASLDISQDYEIMDEYPSGQLNGTPVFPAIAIPVESKNSFECPPTHVEVLVDLIPTTRKILTIGWRATEAHFLSLLAERLPRGVDVFVVSGDVNKAEETTQHLRISGVTGNFLAGRAGFTEMVVTREIDEFLKRK